MMNDFMLELAGVFAVNSVKKEFGLVCAIFNSAVKLGVIERNPRMGGELPKDKKADMKALSGEGLLWRSMVLCSLYLGGQRLGDVAMLR